MDGVDSIGFLLRAILYRASQDAVNPIEDLTQDILIASRLLNEYECARWFGLETEGLFPANVGAQMRHSMLKVLCRRGRDFLEPLNAWRKSLPLMPDSAAEGPKACRDSGHLVNVSRAISLISGVQDRRIVCCNSCGLVQNIPIPWSVDFTFSSTRRAVLTIDPKPQFWEANLLIKPQLASASQAYAWPNDGTAEFSTEFQVPHPLPSGPLEVGVILMAGHELAVVALRTHSDAIEL